MQPGRKESWSSRNHTSAVWEQGSPSCPQRELHPHGQGAKAPPQPFPCSHHPSQRDPVLLEMPPQAARPESTHLPCPFSEICIILRCPRSDPCPPPWECVTWGAAVQQSEFCSQSPNREHILMPLGRAWLGLGCSWLCQIPSLLFLLCELVTDMALPQWTKEWKIPLKPGKNPSSPHQD